MEMCNLKSFANNLQFKLRNFPHSQPHTRLTRHAAKVGRKVNATPHKAYQQIYIRARLYSHVNMQKLTKFFSSRNKTAMQKKVNHEAGMQKKQNIWMCTKYIQQNLQHPNMVIIVVQILSWKSVLPSFSFCMYTYFIIIVTFIIGLLQNENYSDPRILCFFIKLHRAPQWKRCTKFASPLPPLSLSARQTARA